MSQTIDTLQPGQIARVRQRTYLVEQIVKPKRAADSTLVKLSCVDDDKGRAWFQLPTGESVRYDGSNGFLWRSAGNADRYLSLDAITRERIG